MAGCARRESERSSLVLISSRGWQLPNLYTIGFTKKDLKDFIGRLQDAGVDAIVDIRLRPNSQLSGFAMQRHLPFLLEAYNISYEYQPDLAPTDEILNGYRKDKDWAAYEERFRPMLAERAVEATGQALLARYNAPCLLCSEDTADQCHRRLVAEYWAGHIPNLEIVHL